MSNSANTQALTEKAENKITKIKVTEKLEFEANTKVRYLNTIELSSILDSMFSGAMRDYVGSKITLMDGSAPHLTDYVPMGKFYVSLYFKDRSASKDKCPIENVILRSAGTKGSKYNTLMHLNGMSSGRQYTITPETYEALDEYRFSPNRKVNWNNLTSEIATNFGYYGSYNQEIVACVTGLDLEKIITEIYGDRTEDGVFQYQAEPAQIVANTNGEYVIRITQLDVNKLSDLRKQLGGPINSGEFHQCVR